MFTARHKRVGLLRIARQWLRRCLCLHGATRTWFVFRRPAHRAMMSCGRQMRRTASSFDPLPLGNPVFILKTEPTSLLFVKHLLKHSLLSRPKVLKWVLVVYCALARRILRKWLLFRKTWRVVCCWRHVILLRIGNDDHFWCIWAGLWRKELVLYFSPFCINNIVLQRWLSGICRCRKVAFSYSRSHF